MAASNLFAQEDEDESQRYEPGERTRCTPEAMLAFLRDSIAVSGRAPTLAECRQKFGGILAVYKAMWRLEDTGRTKDYWPVDIPLPAKK